MPAKASSVRRAPNDREHDRFNDFGEVVWQMCGRGWCLRARHIGGHAKINYISPNNLLSLCAAEHARTPFRRYCLFVNFRLRIRMAIRLCFSLNVNWGEGWASTKTPWCKRDHAMGKSKQPHDTEHVKVVLQECNLRIVEGRHCTRWCKQCFIGHRKRD